MFGFFGVNIGNGDVVIKIILIIKRIVSYVLFFSIVMFIVCFCFCGG